MLLKAFHVYRWNGIRSAGEVYGYRDPSATKTAIDSPLNDKRPYKLVLGGGCSTTLSTATIHTGSMKLLPVITLWPSVPRFIHRLCDGVL